MAASPGSLPSCSKVLYSASKRRAAPPVGVALLAFAAVWVIGCAGSKPPAAASASKSDAAEAAGAASGEAEDPEDPVPAGPLSQKAIEQIIQSGSARFQPCYDAGRKKNPSLRGRVMARIVIGNDGRVAASEDGGSNMPDAGVVKCVLAGFKKLRFPLPEESFVTVNYPMQFDGEEGNTGSMLTSGPFRGCSVAAGTVGDQGGKSGTTTEIACGSKKLVVTDVAVEASSKAAQGHLSRFEESCSSSGHPRRSSPKLEGRSSWVTVVQDKGKSWGTMVVLAFGTEKTRVVECSGKPNGVSLWCERQITALSKGYSPSALLYGSR